MMPTERTEQHLQALRRKFLNLVHQMTQTVLAKDGDDPELVNAWVFSLLEAAALVQVSNAGIEFDGDPGKMMAVGEWALKAFESLDELLAGVAPPIASASAGAE